MIRASDERPQGENSRSEVEGEARQSGAEGRRPTLPSTIAPQGESLDQRADRIGPAYLAALGRLHAPQGEDTKLIERLSNHLPDCATNWADGDCDCANDRLQEAIRALSTPSSLPIAPDHVLVQRNVLLDLGQRHMRGKKLEQFRDWVSSLTAAPQPPSHGQGERWRDFYDEIFAAIADPGQHGGGLRGQLSLTAWQTEAVLSVLEDHFAPPPSVDAVARAWEAGRDAAAALVEARGLGFQARTLSAEIRTLSPDTDGAGHG